MPYRSEEHITAEAASALLARQLIVPKGLPLLVRKRVVWDQGGSAIEFAINYNFLVDAVTAWSLNGVSKTHITFPMRHEEISSGYKFSK